MFEKEFIQSYYGYRYRKLTNDLWMIRVEFPVQRSGLRIIEKLIDVGYHRSSLTSFIRKAMINQVELDLHSPESIAQDFCKRLLEEWESAKGKKKEETIQR